MDYHKYGPERDDSGGGYEYGYDYDHTQVYVKQFREKIEAKGYIKYSSFSEIESDYSVAIIHKPGNGLPRVITGKFAGIKNGEAQVVTTRRGIVRIISSTKILNLPVNSDSEYELYASSGSFDTWDDILPFLSEG
jgi:hypothetical protein